MSESVSLTPALQVVDGKPMAKSSDVASYFHKQHKDVLRRIQSLEIPEEWRKRNFTPTFKTVPGPNGSERQEPAYLMTRDGFTLLAMGFTGKRAMAFKLAYIEAFNRMEEALRNSGRKTYSAPHYEVKNNRRPLRTKEGVLMPLLEEMYKDGYPVAGAMVEVYHIHELWNSAVCETQELRTALYQISAFSTQQAQIARASR